LDISLFAVNIFLIIILFAGVSLTMVGLPGNLLVLLAALGYGYWEGFVHLNTKLLWILCGVFLIGETVEFIAGALGAKSKKASGWTITAALCGAVAGSIVGTSFLPLAGSFLGAMLGAFAASYAVEYFLTRDAAKAISVARSVMCGQIIGMVVKFSLGIGMSVAIIAKLPWLG